METAGAPSMSGRGLRRAGAGTVTFDSVTIVTTDGRKLPISELGPAEEMREEIMGRRVDYTTSHDDLHIETAIARRPR
jgi:hypothetical protein